MGKTSIEWTDHSVNPFRATNKSAIALGSDGEEDRPRHGHFCVKISDGCKNCYSSRMQPRFNTFEFVAKNRDKLELWLDENKLLEVVRRTIPTKYFWCDMTDMFLDDYTDEWILKCLDAMRVTPHHIHQILTKRPERMCDLFQRLRLNPIGRDFWFVDPKAVNIGRSFMPLMTHVWVGVSVENQSMADRRLPWLLRTPAAARWVSYEPALGPVRFRNFLPGINWIVVGGESGPGARPFDVRWARDTIAQCQVASVPCFVKQLGAHVIDRNDAGFEGDERGGWPMDTQTDESDAYQGAPCRVRLRSRKGGDPSEWAEDLRVREFPGKGEV